jgi:hypothetical protein
MAINSSALKCAALALVSAAAFAPTAAPAIAAIVAAAAAGGNRRTPLIALLLAAHAHAAFLPLHPEERPASAVDSTAPAHTEAGQVFFDKIGETSFAMGAAGLAMSFNVSHLIGVLDHLEGKLAAWAETEKFKLTPTINFNAGAAVYQPADFVRYNNKAAPGSAESIARHQLANIQRVKSRARAILSFQKPLNDAHHRSKRFIFFTALFIASLVVAASSTAMGLYSTIELQNVKSEARAQGNVLEEMTNATTILEDQITETQDALDSQRTHLDHAATAILLQDVAMAIHTIEQRVSDMENILAASMAGRIAPAALADRDLDAALHHMSRTANRMKHTILLRFPSDFLQCSCSFLMTEHGFDLVAHVPIAPEDSILNVYQYTPMPMPVHTNFYASVSSPTTIIAVNADEDKFRAISQATLATCRRIGTVFQCDKFNVVRRAQQLVPKAIDDEMCLFSLFRRKLDHARDTCNWRLIARPETAAQINRDTFAVVAQQSHRGIINCWNTSTTETLEITAGEVMTHKLQPGCRAQTNAYIMASPMDGRDERLAVVHETSAAAFALMSDEDFKEVENMRKDNQNLLFTKQEFSLSEATQAWVHSRQRTWHGFAAGGWSHPSTIINFLLWCSAAAVALLIVWLCIKKKQELAKHYNTPPSAPTTAIHFNARTEEITSAAKGQFAI